MEGETRRLLDDLSIGSGEAATSPEPMFCVSGQGACPRLLTSSSTRAYHHRDVAKTSEHRYVTRLERGKA